jgi:nitronate monooxygenase
MTAKAFSTPLSRELGLKYPILIAPMFIISNAQMLIAASQAGIMGAIPSLNGRTHEDFRTILEEIRRHTDGPFAVNMTIGLTSADRREKDFQACLDFEVPVLITSYGDPTDYVRRAKEKNIKVFHDVINLKHAQKAQNAGVNAIIAVAGGAGGHAGVLSPFAMIPYLKENLNVPIIAAGAISGGAQVVSSLALGAELCYMGTRFIASTECGASQDYKEMVVQAGPEDIVYTDKVSGTHANFIKQSLPNMAASDDTGKKWKDIWSAGHGVAQIKEINSIENIVEGIAKEYHDTLAKLGAY